jgi:hypothetical protein
MVEKINEEDREFLLKLCIDIIRGADVEPIDYYIADMIIEDIEKKEEK